MKIILPVTWEMCGFVEVEAESIEALLESGDLPDILDDMELPKGEYVDGSFWLSSDDPKIISCYQDPELFNPVPALFQRGKNDHV